MVFKLLVASLVSINWTRNGLIWQEMFQCSRRWGVCTLPCHCSCHWALPLNLSNVCHQQFHMFTSIKVLKCLIVQKFKKKSVPWQCLQYMSQTNCQTFAKQLSAVHHQLIAKQFPKSENLYLLLSLQDIHTFSPTFIASQNSRSILFKKCSDVWIFRCSTWTSRRRVWLDKVGNAFPIVPDCVQHY